MPLIRPVDRILVSSIIGEEYADKKSTHFLRI